MGPSLRLTIAAVICCATRAAAQLCPPAPDDVPCVVSRSTRVPADSFIDLGHRALVVAEGRTIRVVGDEGLGTFHLFAGSVQLERGARIIARGGKGFVGLVFVSAAGDIRIGTGARGDRAGIDVSGQLEGGSVDLVAGGDITVGGRLRGRARSRDGFGGVITLDAGGDVTVAGPGVDVRGGNRAATGGSGGDLTVFAGGVAALDAPVDVSGGDAGIIDVEGGGTVTTSDAATLRLDGRGGAAYGGILFLVSLDGDVLVDGPISARPAGTLQEGAGIGGEVEFHATAGTVELRAPIDVAGVSPEGGGGTVGVESGRVALRSTIRAGGPADGFGGDVAFAVFPDSGPSSAVLAGDIDVSAGVVGGIVELTVIGPMALEGTIRADGSPSVLGGRIELEACRLRVEAGATVSSVGGSGADFAANLLRVRDEVTIAGTLLAGGANRLTMETGAPTILPGAVIEPALDVITGRPFFPGCP